MTRHKGIVRLNPYLAQKLLGEFIARWPVHSPRGLRTSKPRKALTIEARAKLNMLIALARRDEALEDVALAFGAKPPARRRHK